MKKIKVLIVDDHTLVRDGIRALLALVADIEVVGEAANGKEALEKIEELGAGRGAYGLGHAGHGWTGSNTPNTPSNSPE